MADQKISQLDAIASVAGEDLLAVVDDPSGTPVTKKATVTQLAAAIGGGGTFTGAEGSEPGSPSDGQLYFPNNAPWVKRYNGSAWVPWGPLFPLTKPVSGDFAWINQGGAAVSDTNGSIFLSAPAASGVNWRIRKKAAPSTPYTITAGFLLSPAAPNFYQVGLVFRQSGDGKLHVFTVQGNNGNNNNLNIGSLKYTSPTAFSAIYGTQEAYIGGNMVWLRIADNGTNRICSVSADGQNFTTFHSIGRTDFLTADEVGFGIDLENTTFDNHAVLLSWKQG